VGAIRKIKGVLVHPQQLHDVLRQFRDVERFRIVIDQPVGERYERVRLQIATCNPVGDPKQFAERVAAAVKSAILLQMQVEFVSVADIPEEASRPPYRDTICDLRPGKTLPHEGA
jgi:phenylacetate-coenzyme A ligase PaaK-like adenylate-forming protein